MSYRYESGNFAVTGNSSTIDGLTKGIVCQVSPGAKLPNRAHPTDAGADVCAYLPGCSARVVTPGNAILVDTGVAVKIPIGYGGFVLPRSSMRAKQITCYGDGLIDSDYRGTIKLVIGNHGTEDYVIEDGDRIGQLVIQSVVLCNYIDGWNDTERGNGGFGSTGK